MLLAVDIGNTNVTFGVFEGEKLVNTWRMATDASKMPDEYGVFLLNLINMAGLEPSKIHGISMCSTVPPLISIFQQMFANYFKAPLLTLGPGTKSGVRIRTDNPRELGPDRIANSAAAHQLYEGPVIIVDLGTATTFDVVSRDGDLLGAVIAPGITDAARALFTRAAALPQVELVAPKHAIGTNTVASMQSGIIFGYAGLIEGIVARINRQLGEKAQVVATGGYAPLVVDETPVIDEVNPDITLIGLMLIYLMNQS